MGNGKLPQCTVPHSLDKNGRVTATPKHNVTAPYGLKLLALDRRAFCILYRVFCQLPCNYCAEQYFELLLLQAAKGESEDSEDVDEETMRKRIASLRTELAARQAERRPALQKRLREAIKRRQR